MIGLKSTARRSCLLLSIVSVWCGPFNTPRAELLLATLIAFASSSSVMLRAASFFGSTSTRSAYLRGPKIATCPTPSSVDNDGAMTFSAKSSRSESDIDGDDTASIRIGASAGLVFRYAGNSVSSAGRPRWARRIAACTSTAAASMFR